MGRILKTILTVGIATSVLAGCVREESSPAGKASPAPSQEAPGDGATVADSVLFSAQIDRRGDPILLPLTIGDQEYRFMFDSGATHHFFDASLRPLLGEPCGLADVITSGQPLSAQAFEFVQVNVGGMPLAPTTPVVCTDLEVIRVATGEDVHGLLGMPFLESHRIRIDWDRGMIEILEADEDSFGDWGVAVDVMTGELPGPMIEGTVAEGRSANFLVDTGANTTGSLSSVLFQELAKKDLLEIIGTQSLATASGVVNRDKGRLRSLRIGGMEYQELIFSEGTSNNLGLRFLRRHTVVFDLSRNRIYLRPSAAFANRDLDDMSGLRLISNDNKSLVYVVQSGSPAHLAGIQRGDEVVSVDGKVMPELTLGDLRALLRSEPGREVSLVVSRNSQPISYTFCLREEPWN